MAQSTPHKLPRGKADKYNMVPLSDTGTVQSLLSGLNIAACNPSEETDVRSQTAPQTVEVSVGGDHGEKVYTVSTRMSCNFCTVVFTSRTEQKAHFKSDWHRYNLKQHLRDEVSVTEKQFENMTDNLSSISGSDDTTTTSDDEDTPSVKPANISSRPKKCPTYDSTDSTDSESEGNSAIMAATRKHPKVFLRNGSGQLVSLYRCVLYHKKSSPSTPAELLSMAEQAKAYTRVAVVMLAGGHFSAAIFDGSEAVVHKTFHRYVVRAKRGVVQSVRDSQGSAPKSGGASLRRYNEAALAQEIQELLTTWSPQMKTCSLIFLRTSTYSRHIFFGGKSPVFAKDDLRIRTIPFSTGRPTYNEARRVHQMLMSVECFGDESLITEFVPVSPARHLNPQTGELVVRPENSQPRTPNNQSKMKGKEKKAKTDSKTDRKADTVVESAQPAPVSDNSDQSDDGEIELVEALMEIRTDDLQEFACSVNGRKRNKKKKKKGNQKTPEDNRPAQGNNRVDAVELNEEDQKLKNRLYTCCKSGDVTQLFHILHTAVLVGRLQECASKVGQEKQDAAVFKNDVALNQGDIPQSVCTNETDLTADSKSVSEKMSETDTEDKSSRTTNHIDNCDAQDREEIHISLASIKSASSEVKVSVETNVRTMHTDGDTHVSQSVDDKTVSDGDSSSPGVNHDRFQGLVLGKYGEKELSLLHIAAAAGHANIITALLEAGCDPALRDSSGKTSYLSATTKEVKNAFRRFRGEHPDRYDYEAAQIPSALTADMEAERKQREAEKKKAQKKAKQERLKERKAEEAKATKEQKEKDRFLALSDREKRALAAERRLLEQTSGKGTVSVLNRCYQCGVDISGKVPFEYMDFQFCSPKCLKEHRMKQSSTSR